MYLAFKIKATSFLERLVRFFTDSDAVHCELVTALHRDQFFGYTSLPLEGVVKRWYSYDPDEWTFIEVRANPNDVLSFYEKAKGKKYDYLGCLGFVINVRENPNRYFCSEFCAEALSLKNPSSYTPGRLMEYFETFENLKCRDAES